jgi:hypothetical protein
VLFRPPFGRNGTRATVDMSLAHLLLPQLVAFRDAGYDLVGVSAAGEHVATLAEHGIRHVALSRSTSIVASGG